MALPWWTRLVGERRDGFGGGNKGFAEAPAPPPVRKPRPRRDDAAMPTALDVADLEAALRRGAEQIARTTQPPPFPSTGPHGHRARMRQKLLERGAEALADYELLEMLLFFAQPKGDTKPIAKAAINRFGSYAAVLAAPQRELFDTPGLGEHSVAALKLVQASALRLARAEVMDRPVLDNWERLTAYLTAAMGREKIEQFRILFLDNRNRLVADEVQGRGTVGHTPVYPREIVKRAFELHATALILVHNHPSGDPAPSHDDIEMTQDIKLAGTMLGLTLHDHIIVGNGTWLSFRDEGLL